ncbi:MAG: NUDIX hydrolase [Gammaproteobacteria bacterium]|mgnify:FL=1|nr:NUDIX hydrolase [Gammaproteobacteria bacterium]
MHRRELLQLLAGYRTRFMEEGAYLRRARAFVEAQPDCFYRELWPAHVTGSAWVVNPGRSHVLLMHHRKHDQWFQPGGHADGDADILRVALRETVEETGLDPAQVRLVDGGIFDLDIHTIPPMGGDPEHSHIDVRFLVEIDDHLPIPGNDESHEVRWVALHEVSRYNNSPSTRRMVEKTRWLRNIHVA